MLKEIHERRIELKGITDMHKRRLSDYKKPFSFYQLILFISASAAGLLFLIVLIILKSI